MDGVVVVLGGSVAGGYYTIVRPLNPVGSATARRPICQWLAELPITREPPLLLLLLHLHPLLHLLPLLLLLLLLLLSSVAAEHLSLCVERFDREEGSSSGTFTALQHTHTYTPHTNACKGSVKSGHTQQRSEKTHVETFSSHQSDYFVHVRRRGGGNWSPAPRLLVFSHRVSQCSSPSLINRRHVESQQD